MLLQQLQQLLQQDLLLLRNHSEVPGPEITKQGFGEGGV
jgi:hypothetical protein